ncbi:MAG: hypothetical protein AAB393_03760, partial [Bacteroidota bacterium]
EPNASVVQRSSLAESRFFDVNAVSHQDFIASYTDRYTRNPTTGDTIPGHTPMNITVRQESYAWNFPFADFFVILNYTIYNTGRDTLDSVYVGFWNNGVVRNTNNVRPGTPAYFDHGANGFTDSLRMMYTFDFDGIPTPPPADSYVAIKLLGSAPFPSEINAVDSLRRRTYFNGWRFRSSSGESAYFSPSDDAENVGGSRSRFDRLASSLLNGPSPADYINQLRLRADNVTTLLSTGPFSTLRPGDSLNLVFGVLSARKVGVNPARYDSLTQRFQLLKHAGLCQQAYDGEDINGNNRLDPGEDLDGNGKLDHYRLPQPPRPPKVRVDVGSQSAAIYWDRSTSELSI